MLLTPLLVCAMLQYMQSLQNLYTQSGIEEFPVRTLPKVKQCRSDAGPDQPCASIGYSIIGTKRDVWDPAYDEIHKIMEKVADLNDLSFGNKQKDVFPLSAGGSEDLKRYLLQHRN